MRVQGAKKNPNLTQVSEPAVAVSANENQSKARIHNVFIVDASGSMSGGKYVNAITGLNELLVSIANDTDSENTATIVEFEDHNIKTRLDVATKIPKTYKGTGGMTPLNQAIGETLEYIVKTRKDKYDVSDKILVNVFTDGGENSSQGKYRNPDNLSSLI